MKETKFKGYFVDEKGNVWSSKRGELAKMHTRPNNRGYIQVVISDKGKQKCLLVHRLIAETYLGSLEGLTVNHKNGDKLNNYLDNLEIISQKENNRHALNAGLTKVGEAHSKAKISDSDLIDMIKEIQGGLSTVKASVKYGLSQSYVSKVMRKVYRQDIWSKM